ncbi:hypothetical protein GGI04_001770 [Coemansia thaxteri]|nr:hypothetical protein GGI04_001770 [Coemansia thaxteri]KAJ2469316.1 hypothetical protein GGI02_003430 [Coemansia sp. RSA 2322]
MSVFSGKGGLNGTVLESDFTGPQPSRYVPRPKGQEEPVNRLASTPSLYGSENGPVARDGGPLPPAGQHAMAGPMQHGYTANTGGPRPPYGGPGGFPNGGPAAGPLSSGSFTGAPLSSSIFAGSPGYAGGAPAAAGPQHQQPQYASGSIIGNGSGGSMALNPGNGGGVMPHNANVPLTASTMGPVNPGPQYLQSTGSSGIPGGASYYAPSSGTPSMAGNSVYGGGPPPPQPHSAYGGPPPPRPYGPSYATGSAYSGPQPLRAASSRVEEGQSSRMQTAGKLALGALAAGAVAYSVHELVDDGDSEDERRRRRAQDAAERQRRETEARRRREEEEEKRREDHERWRIAEDERHRLESVYSQQQQQAMQPQAGYASSVFGAPQSVYAPSVHGRRRADSAASSHHSSLDGGFRPPAPFGRPPYSYDPNDVRFVDPSRSSEASPTPETYPELRHTLNDTVVKIGTVLALRHRVTSRFLRTDRSHSTQSGSNQQLVYAHRRNPAADDWWQVLPANQDVPIPGSIVSYGSQIRLRHLGTGRHLHSHYRFIESRAGQNEVSAYGDQTLSDENDHWVVERWGDGAYGQTWRSTEPVVLRHYVSGMALHSHGIMLRDDVQSVTCHGPGSSDNDEWRVVLAD